MNKIKTIKHFYTVNHESENLLKNKGIKNSACVGDIRMDRVIELTSIIRENKFIEHFINNDKCWVAGSTWKEDYDLFIEYIRKKNKGYKL